MEGGLLSLKWNNHRTTFFHVLSTIRKKEIYCDTTLACDGKFYPVHKLVLSTCSEYFEQIFERAECKHPVIVLKDVVCDDLEALLNYMYLGEVNVLQEKLASLIKAAECLKIRGLAVPDEEPSSSVGGREKRSSSSHDVPEGKRRKSDNDNLRTKDVSTKSHSTKEEISRVSPVRESSKITDSSSRSNHYTDDLGEASHNSSGSESSRKNSRTTDQYQSRDPIYSDTGGGVEAIDNSTDFDADVKKEPQEVFSDSEDNKDDLLQVQASLGYLSNDPGGSSVDGGHDNDFRDSMPGHSDEVTNSDIPGVSGVQMKNWDSNESIVGASYEGYGDDDGSGHLSQMASDYGSDYWYMTDTLPAASVMQLRRKSSQTTLACSYCDKTFRGRYALHRHERIHSNDKPFLCPRCPYRSNRRDNLKSHVLFKHDPSDADLI